MILVVEFVKCLTIAAAAAVVYRQHGVTMVDELDRIAESLRGSALRVRREPKPGRQPCCLCWPGVVYSK